MHGVKRGVGDFMRGQQFFGEAHHGGIVAGQPFGGCAVTDGVDDGVGHTLLPGQSLVCRPYIVIVCLPRRRDDRQLLQAVRHVTMKSHVLAKGCEPAARLWAVQQGLEVGAHPPSAAGDGIEMLLLLWRQLLPLDIRYTSHSCPPDAWRCGWMSDHRSGGEGSYLMSACTHHGWSVVRVESL